MQSSASRRSFLNYIGIAILLAGLGAGEFIYWRSLQRGPAAGDDSYASLAGSKDYDRVIGTQVGTFGSIILQWDHALAEMEEPGPLAITISAVSVLAACGCFLVASRMPRV
jgi:hypothetical protein